MVTMTTSVRKVPLSTGASLSPPSAITPRQWLVFLLVDNLGVIQVDTCNSIDDTTCPPNTGDTSPVYVNKFGQGLAKNIPG